MSLENIPGIGYAPHFHSWHEYSGYMIAGVEKPPKEVIDDIVVFNEGKEFLMNSDQKEIFSTDMLRELLVLSVPFDSAKYGLVGPHEWGRALPLLSGEIPYAGIMGTTVSAKGLFITGSRLSRTDYHGELTGIFGEKDAKKEINIANDLLEHEFRSSLPIGYIIFNRKEWSKLLMDAWKGNVLMQAHIQRLLLLTQSEELVCLFRITSQMGRFESHPPRNTIETIESIPRRRADIAILANLLLSELAPGFWLHKNDIQVTSDTYRGLQNIASPLLGPLSENEIKALDSTLTKIATKNSEKLKKMLDSHPKHCSTNLVDMLMTDHDTNLNIVHQDYESVRRSSSGSSVSKADEYHNQMIKVIRRFRNELFENHISLEVPKIHVYPDFTLE